MINWKKATPTFAGWVGNINRSTAYRVAFDAWRAIEHRCVIEVNREVRRITIWESGPSGSRKLDSLESRLTTTDNPSENLSAELAKIGAHGLACDLLLHPPWAVAKVFELTQQESENPAQWIARHRSEVFPVGIENDVVLSYTLQSVESEHATLIVGLARRSAIDTIKPAVERAGCQFHSTVIGPVAALQRSSVRLGSGDTVALENAGGGSIGCWLIQDTRPIGWVELPVQGDSGTDSSDAIADRLHDLLGADWTDVTSIQCQEVTPYTPPAILRSHWRIPSRVHVSASEIVTSERPSGVRVAVIDPWLSWVFRWSLLVASAALVLAGSIAGLATLTRGISGHNADEVASSYELRESLQSELSELRKRESKATRSSSGAVAGRLWFDLGQGKPVGMWLRQIKAVQPKDIRQPALWLVEGLTNQKGAPESYAEDLVSISGYRTRLTRLERAETAKLKDLPASMRGELYRFAIEIQP